MNELTLVIFAALLGAASAFHIFEAREWRNERKVLIDAAAAERSRLLDRVMARNYNEFVYTATAATVETPQLTTDEAEAKWAISHRGDADELWHRENAKEHPELYPDGIGEVA